MKYKLVVMIDVLENITGGAERQVYELLKAIDRERFSTWLYVIHQRDVPQEIKDFQLPMPLLTGQAGNNQSITNDQLPINTVRGLGIKRIYDVKGITEGMKFARFLRREKIDAVMTYHFGADIWGAYFAKRAGVPLIISNRRDEGFWRNKTHIRAYKWVNKWVDKIIAVSKAVQKMAIDEGVPEEKIELLYSGVDLTRFDVKVDIAKKRKEIEVPVDAKLIACVGNFNPIKGHSYLIDAMAEVVKQVPTAHLILIGDGPLKESYMSQVSAERSVASLKGTRQCGVKRSLPEGDKLERNVHFLGKRSDVPELLKISDLCVLPSLSEGLSNALLEYMAAGKPVIATRVGGNPDVITNEVNGVLVKAKDSGELAREILRLIQDTKMQEYGEKRSLPGGDARYAEGLGANARKTVEERFDLKKQIGSLQDFIGREIGKAQNPRVLHLISSGGLFGAERVMLSLAKKMNMNGTAVWIGAINNTHNPHLEVVDESRKDLIPCGIFDSHGQVDFGCVNRIAHFVHSRKISLIHTHNYKSTILGLLVSWRSGVPMVTTNHLWTKAGKKLRFYEFLEGVFLKFFVKRVIAVSDAIKKDMVDSGISAKKIDVIYNGIDVKIQDTRCKSAERKGASPEGIQDIRKELGIAENAIVIATIARLSPEKGHTFLFQAAQRLLNERKDIAFMIVGDGYLRKDLEDEAAKRGIQANLFFTGYRNDMNNVYEAVDIVVQPSLREGIPVTLLEAMSHEKPVIATDVGGVSSLIRDGKTGLLIDPGDWEQLYSAIKKFLDDRSFRESMGRNARELVKREFSEEKMVTEYKRLYSEVLGAGDR